MTYKNCNSDGKDCSKYKLICDNCVEGYVLS